MGDSDETQPLRGSGSSVDAGLSGIERFTIVKKLGEGGMGSVYLAYDSMLDRNVAVKLVRRDRLEDGGTIAPRDQLLREAQAMARLSHPNVVAVHEVGSVTSGVYVVLELVDGTTLREWQRERPRSWREIVAAYVQAGRGLEAAHAAGLVHRDFKPANVMMRKDGRVLVGDFGVVSMGGAPSPSGSSPEPATSEITFVGRRVGTLGFMPPEQHAGAAVDARADQFSFCVALWDALYGARPFTGDVIRADAITPPPADTKVPRRIEAALRRGLAERVEDRWPAMAELLAELERDPAAARRRWIVGGAVAAAMIAIAVTAWLGWTRSAEPACEGRDAELAQHWSAAHAAALRSAFARSGQPYARLAADRVTAQLDRWGAQWSAEQIDACRATRITGEQSEALLDARTRCLDRELDEVDALVAALTTSDGAVIQRAAQELALPELAMCADRDYVLARVPPPAIATTRERAVALDHELARIAAAERTGRFHDARPQAAAAVTEATALGFAPVLAEALLIRGRLEEQDGDLAVARDTLSRAVHVAGASRDDRTLARTLGSLLEVLVARAETPAAIALGVAADAVTLRTGDRRLEAELAEQLGAAHALAGDAAAASDLQHALELRTALDGPESLAVAQLENRLAAIDLAHDRTAQARTRYEHAVQIAVRELGDDHPATAIAHANLCYLDAAAGQLDAAHACQQRVLAVLERVLGPEHPQVAWALNDIALVDRDRGDLVAAAAGFERAIAIWEKTVGADHPDLALSLINLGEIALERGDRSRGEAACQRALAIVEHALGASHPDAAPALGCLAEAALPRAPRDAVALARRALAIAPPGEEAAELRFALARGLAAIGARGEALEAATAARDHAGDALRTKLDAWLRANRAKI